MFTSTGMTYSSTTVFGLRTELRRNQRNVEHHPDLLGARSDVQDGRIERSYRGYATAILETCALADADQQEANAQTKQ